MCLTDIPAPGLPWWPTTIASASGERSERLPRYMAGPPGDCEVTRRIPWYGDDEGPLSELMHSHPNFKSLQLSGIWADLARLAEPLVGIPRHLSLHPGGVVIVPTALTDYVPWSRR